MEKAKEDLRKIIEKAQLGLKLTDERQLKQMLTEICFITAEYVTK